MNSQLKKPTLKLDWCSHAAARYAVETWHYSKSMPAGKRVFVGAWEAGKFIGCVMFWRGANRNMAGQYGLKTTECVELNRVALNSEHASPVSRIGAIAIRFLRTQSPGIRLIVSYADPAQNHHGGIYQAMGWLYVGTSCPQSTVRGMHKRTATTRYGSTKGLPRTAVTWKHKYLMPLDEEMRKRILPLSKPYPKRAGSDTKDTAANHAEKGGSIPTPALQLQTT